MAPWELCTLLSGCAATTRQLVVCAVAQVLICGGFNQYLHHFTNLCSYISGFQSLAYKALMVF